MFFDSGGKTSSYADLFRNPLLPTAHQYCLVLFFLGISACVFYFPCFYAVFAH